MVRQPTLPLVTPMLGAGVLAVAGATVAAALEANDPKLQRERLRIGATGIAGAAMLLWPMLWRGLGLRLDSWMLALAFVWTLALCGFDLHNAARRSRGTPAEEAERERELRATGDRLVGAVWSLGALLLVLRQSARGGGARRGAPQHGFSRDAARVVLAALLCVIIFVMPSAEPPEQVSRILLYQAQRCALHFACGLYAAGVILVLRRPGAA